MHRVLIVDDSALVLAQLTDVLASLGMEVAGSAASGPEAVERARELSPDIVLMDILMPGSPDGIEAARIIKDRLDIPVIFLSAATDEAVLARAGAAGAYGFLAKPANPVELKTSIEIALARRASETGLREILKDVVENTNDLVYVVDGTGRLKYVNEPIMKIGGFTKDNYLGKSFASFLTPESMVKAAGLFRRQVKGEDIGPFELDFVDHAGTVRVIEIREGLVWKDGRIVEVHGIGRDVTDRKRAEEELLATREQYRLLVENAAEGIVVIQDGLVKYANPAVLKLAGYPEGGLVGLPFIQFVHPDDREAVTESYQRVLAGQEVPPVVTRRYLDRSGSVHIVQNSSVRGTWEGRPAAIVLINDVTEARLTEQLLTIQRDIGIMLSVEEELAGAMAHIMDRLVEIPGVDCAAIHLVDDADGAMKMEAHRGVAEGFASRVAVYAPDCPEAVEVRAGRTVVLSRSQIAANPDLGYIRDEGLTFLVVAPVFFEGAAVGSIDIGSHAEDSVSPHIVAALEDIAVRLGSALRRIKDQEQLAESEKKYRTLIENAKEGIVVLQDGLIKYVNPTGQRISGRADTELIGRPFDELIYPEDLAGVAARYESEMAGEKTLAPYAYRVVWKDGTIRWVEGIGIPIEWEGHRASLTFIEDITEAKLVKDALVESEQKFHSVFETSRDFMYIAASDGMLLDYSSSAKSFFGYADEEIARLNLRDLYAYPEERDAFLQKVIREGFVENYELRLKKKDGTLVTTLVTAVVRRDSQGNPVGTQGSVKDITRLKRLERQLVQSEKLSSLGTMISGIAHELNNPLAAIMGNAEILSRSPDLPQQVVSRLDTISRESVRASRIIKGLLSFAREHKPERRLISVNDCVMESYKLREYNLKVSNVQVELSLSTNLPATYADPYQIQQVFVNIINNARDALAGREGATLAIGSQQHGQWVVVEFTDNGPGIEPENLKRIFDPFFTTKEVGEGTGLGLSMAYGIVNEHGGTIEAASAPGKGTTFTVTLPVTRAPKPDRNTAEVSITERHPGKRILVVEDEGHLRALYLDVLTERGYEVLTASGADEAIGLIRERQFDAVITDIRMPGPGGVGLYRYIVEKQPGLAGKVIFITGDILGAETRAFLSTTDCVYLEKPFKINDLLNALGSVLR